MPRDPKTLLPASAFAAAPGFTLTPGDNVFLDEVDRMLHLALDRLGAVLESIQPPTKYDFPAPHLPRDPEASPFAAPKTFVPDFIPYAREFLRSVKGLQTLCNIWVMLKTTRAQPQPNPQTTAPSQAGGALPGCDAPSATANPRLRELIANLQKSIPKTMPPRP